MSLTGRKAAEDRITRELIELSYQAIKDGLHAVKVKVFNTEAGIVLGPPQVDYTERRETAKTVLQLADHFPQREDHEAHQVAVTIVGLDPAKAFGAVSVKHGEGLSGTPGGGAEAPLGLPGGHHETTPAVGEREGDERA